jgi:HK97 gp10 family phage protein
MAKMLGLEAVLARLEKIPREVRAAVEEQIEKEVADLVAAEKRAAPASHLEAHPGQLRDSIEAYPSPDNPLRRRIIVGARDAKGRLFGSYVEFGHTSPDGSYTPARPFFWPTYRSRAKGIRRRIASAATRAFKRVQFPTVK